MPSIDPFQLNTTCSVCGQTDDHPKSFMLGMDGGAQHIDCLTDEQRAQVISANPDAADAVAASTAGVQGPALTAVLRATIAPHWL